MCRSSRWPVAVTSFGLIAAAATLATEQLRGQPSQPLPPPVGAGLPTALPAPERLPTPDRDPVSFRDVVKRVLPSVVNIEAKVSGRPGADPARRPAPLPSGVPEEFRRFFEPPEPGSQQPRESDLGFGSGVIVDQLGVILTNFHVVDGAGSVEVTLHDGRKFVSRDIRTDPKTDLAVIVVATKDPLPAIPFGDSDAAEVGDRVLAVGAPFGLAGSVTHGIISAKSRQNLRLNEYEDFIQTDAAINPGNSGGPLVDLNGQLVGINCAIKTRSGGFQGVGLAISSNLAREVVTQLLRDGVVRRGYLGVGIRPLDDALAQRFGVAKGAGVVVSRVYENSPAAKAGIQVGDVITSVAGTPVKEINTLPKLVAKLPLGKPAEITLLRDGRTLQVKIVIEERTDESAARPTADPNPRGLPLLSVNPLGLTVADLSPDAADLLGLPRDLRGAVVVSVERNGLAAEAGLARGRVIIKVDRTPVASAKDFATAIAAADPERGALLQVLRPSGEVDFLVLRLR